MIRPIELSLDLPVKLSNGVLSNTTKIWEILVASKKGNLKAIEQLVNECPELIYAQYNYTAPIHFAVREGHTELVKYLLAKGAHSPGYKIYPFQESLQTMAQERGHYEISALLDEYAANRSLQQYQGDNGQIIYNRTGQQNDFERMVDQEDLTATAKMLEKHPWLPEDETYFWGEGILTFAAKENNRKMIDLLLTYGAKVPAILKWAQFYYFEHDEGAAYMMEKGMNPNTMSWHEVTLLHDMAQKGNIAKAELLLKYGANINAVDDEYQSTPLGMAARWGHTETVSYLLQQGADLHKSGAAWSTPLAWARKKQYPEIETLLLNAGAGI